VEDAMIRSEEIPAAGHSIATHVKIQNTFFILLFLPFSDSESFPAAQLGYICPAEQEIFAESVTVHRTPRIVHS